MELSEFFEFQDEIYVKTKKIMYKDIESILTQNPALYDLFNQLMSKIKKLDCVYDKNIYYYRTITKLLQDPYLLKYDVIAEKIIDVFIKIKNYIEKEAKKKNALLSLAIAEIGNIDFFSHFPDLVNDYILSFTLIPKKLKVINKDGFKQSVKFKNEYNILITQYNLIFQILIKYLDYGRVKNLTRIKQKFVNLPNIQEKVELIDACRCDDIPRAKKILDKDLYIKFNTYDGKTIFDIPIESENDKFIKFLISYEEIDLYVHDVNKQIPIKNAYDLINKSVFDILIDRMIDSYTYKGGMRITLLIWAISYSERSVYNYILSSDRVNNINLADSNGRTALIWAIKKKNRHVIDKLLSFPGIDVTVCDKYGNTPLLLSAIHEDIVTMKCLIQNFSTGINIKNSFGNTPLIIATDKKYVEIADLLINDSSIDINACNNNKITALMYAIFKDCDEIIYKLLKHPSLNINAVDNKGNSVLMLAAKKGNLKLVKTILAIPNVDINILNNENKSALVYTIEKSMFKVMQLLLQQKDINVNTVDIMGDTPLTTYIKLNAGGNLDNLKTLLKAKKIDVNIADGDSRTPLILACEKDKTVAVKQLLKIKNIDVNMQDKYKNTALIFAAINRNPDIIKMLTKMNNTDVNICNNIGKTALMLTIKDTKCVQILLKRKDINVNTRDRKGRTALFIALEKKCIDPAKLLMKNKNINPGLRDSKGVSPYDLAIRNNFNELSKSIAKIMKDQKTSSSKGLNDPSHNNSGSKLQCIENNSKGKLITENRTSSIIEKTAVIKSN